MCETCEKASKEHKKVCDSAWEEYKKVCGSAWKEYKKAQAKCKGAETNV